MKLIWKILFGIGILILAFFLLVVGLAINEVISESSYHQKAVWRSNVMFGSPIFYEDLKNCSLAYADSWEIKGLKNNECSLWFVYDSRVNYEQGTIRYIKSFCDLPKEVYSSSELDWDLLIEQEYCYLDYDSSGEENLKEEEKQITHTFWSLGDLPSHYDVYNLRGENGEWTGNQYFLKDKITSNACVVTDPTTTFKYLWQGDLRSETTCKEIMLNKQWLAIQPDDFFPIKVLVYYDFNERGGGTPKVIETEIVI